jgi:peptidoglycan hydrolase-like protein with peptidoglycan-binding domain
VRLRDRGADLIKRPAERAVVAVLLVAAVCLSGCAAPRAAEKTTTTTITPPTSATTSSSTSSTSSTTTTSTLPPTTTTTTTIRIPPSQYLELGSTGKAVLALQYRLIALGYWLGPANGVFGDSTQQAVYALQKAAGIGRDGVVGSQTYGALLRKVRPVPRAAAGSLIEVDLGDDLLMFVDDGKLKWTLNTSTGGGYTYVSEGVTAVADTPVGVFHTFAAINGLDVDPLGELWRPRFFTGGFAIHGDSYVPPEPVSHGCVRVSNEAIDWIWAENLDPIGEEVWVF